MTLDEALAWADKNTEPKAVARLRSRAAVKALADEVRRLRRGEFICRKCGLRKDAEGQRPADF